jgi:very-short-patch-repair endonuclease
MIDPAQLIAQLGGVALASRLQEYGISRTALTRQVRAGRIERIRTGVYAIAALSPAIHAAIAHGGALTCTSLLRAHGVWVLHEGEEPHVWLGPTGHAHEHSGCICVSHYYRGHPPLGRASLENALVHLHGCQGDEAFFAAFESAWRLRLLSRAARARVRQALPASARWLVDLARADADSGLESLLRLRLHLLGIRLRCQVIITGVGKVDFVIGRRLILEADGRENHDGTKKRHKDLVRDAAASRLGYETLRFDYSQIVHDWPTVQAAIISALTRLRDHA